MLSVILSVEDDDAAFRLLEIAFEEIGLEVNLLRAVDGKEAIDFLHKRGVFADAPRPDLVLLNLNLPKVNGIEVLSAMQSNPSLASIRVVVFTSSELDSDRAKCLALGAKNYITKPILFDDLVNVVKSVCTAMPG